MEYVNLYIRDEVVYGALLIVFGALGLFITGRLRWFQKRTPRRSMGLFISLTLLLVGFLLFWGLISVHSYENRNADPFAY